MTPIEKQILKNQLDIMRWIGKSQDGYFKYRIEETNELLNPTEDKNGEGFVENLMKGCGKSVPCKYNSWSHKCGEMCGYDISTDGKRKVVLCNDCEGKFAKGKVEGKKE